MPDTAEAPSAVFTAGLEARAKGEPHTACPYPDESGEREQWLEGWHQPDGAEAPDELGFA